MSNTPSSLLRQAFDRPAPSVQAYYAQLDAARKAMTDWMHPYTRHLENRQKEERASAFAKIDYAAGLIADVDKIAAAIENGEALDDDLIDAYVGLTQESLVAEKKIAADAGNLDRLVEQLAAPLDAMDTMYEKFPVLGARRGALL